MSQDLALRREKLYCKYCKGNPAIKIPQNVNLASPSSDEFVENVRCTICKNIGYVKR